MAAESKRPRAETPEFIPAQRGCWNVGDFRLVNHETGHAVVAAFCGLRVQQARIDAPEYRGGGLVKVEPDLTRLREHLMVTMAGPLAEGRPLLWPVREIGDGDESAAARLVVHLNVDADDWEDLSALVREILELRSVRRASSAIAGALLAQGALPGDDVHRLYSDATANHHRT